ncbi:MAG: DUF1592 domain-containing protein, partial [Gemmata sp.]
MRVRLELFALPAALVAAVWFFRTPEVPARAAQPKAEPSFEAAGVAFLKKHCLSCHGGDKPKADLALDRFTDGASLLKNRKVWQSVLDAVRGGEMPPPNKPKPAVAELEAFTKLVGDVFERHDRAAKPDPGRVTMRRLNRTEYNNTVRDLVGVDFSPAEDFPSDDVGHGFDNIGDVLTLPPVLLERYLAAAETIMARAVTPVPPPPASRGVGTMFTEPAGPKVPMKNNHRVVVFKPDGTPVETGPIFTRFANLPRDGVYTAQTTVYAETTGTKPVRVAILAGCEKGAKGAATDAEADALAGAAVKGLRPFVVLKTFEVTARDEKKADTFRVEVPPDIGLDKIAVALVRPEDGEPAPTLYVRYVSLTGPLDSRPATHRKLLACDESKPVAERSREVLGRFVSRAYRRPVAGDEFDRLLKLADARLAAGDKWEAAMQFAMTAALVSPKFLFRVELDDRPDSADAHPIDEYQLASRLSYFLWSSMPDQELFDLAAKKQLTASLGAQVKRMLRDPRAQALTDNFVMQWLQLQPLKSATPDPNKFPQFNEQLRAAMLTETKLFFAEIVREDRTVLDVLDADFTYVNAPLARHYGLAGPKGPKTRNNEEFVRVDLK